MTSPPEYYVVLDSNVSITERLLQSAIGSAFLFAVSGSRGIIAVPEIVKQEVDEVLKAQAENAVETIRRNFQFLRHLVGHDIAYTAPSEQALGSGISDRWSQLAGILEDVPFTFEDAKQALKRIFRKTAPCNENNEQFRDCCIWEATIRLAESAPVHLITGDKAFYEGRDSTKGLAKSLADEVILKDRNVSAHSKLADFLSAMKTTSYQIDVGTLGDLIVAAAGPRAEEIAAEKDFEVNAHSVPKIKGYATPKANVIAVSFEMEFLLIDRSDRRNIERGEAKLKVYGDGSYDPTSKSIGNIHIEEWSIHLAYGGTGFYGEASSDDRGGERWQKGKVRLGGS